MGNAFSETVFILFDSLHFYRGGCDSPLETSRFILYFLQKKMGGGENSGICISILTESPVGLVGRQMFHSATPFGLTCQKAKQIAKEVFTICRYVRPGPNVKKSTPI